MSLHITTKAGSDWHSRMAEEDFQRRAAERAADPARFATMQKAREELRQKPTVRAAADRAEARSRGEALPYEPTPADLAEMHTRWTHEQIADVCRAIRMQRDMEEFKQAWNLAAQNVGLPLKMIAWPAWGRQ